MSTSSPYRFIRACYREPVDQTPIWIMRQAGRYLPEYREVRAKAGSFMKLCQTPELAAEVTLQPLRRYALDASIIFSDILTIPDAMGLGLSFAEGEGPLLAKPVRTAKDVQNLTVPDSGRLEYVYEAIRLVSREIAGKTPLIGFCGSPWTLSCYMVEGRGKNGFPLLLEMRQKDPQLLHNLLDILAKSVASHLNAQIEAGVDAVMIFDTWGGMLNTEDYQIFSLAYVKAIMRSLTTSYNQRRIPVILFTKGGQKWLESMATTGCDVLGLDWEISLADARRRLQDQVALQGNMNPAMLLQEPAKIREAAGNILASYGQGPGHIFNLGHGITPDVPPEHVSALVDAVHELSGIYHERNL